MYNKKWEAIKAIFFLVVFYFALRMCYIMEIY